MVVVAQLVRALDCGSKGRGFESHLPPKQRSNYCYQIVGSFILITPATYESIGISGERFILGINMNQFNIRVET
jgi:hypothetical protein